MSQRGKKTANGSISQPDRSWVVDVKRETGKAANHCAHSILERGGERQCPRAHGQVGYQLVLVIGAAAVSVVLLIVSLVLLLIFGWLSKKALRHEE